MHNSATVTFTPLVVPTAGVKVCAGFPSPAQEFIERLDLSKILVANPPATFLWRVEGRSMIGRGIFENDILIVDRSIRQRHDDVVIAVVDGECSVKILNLKEPGSLLQFANPSMPACVLPEQATVEIWGVVIWNLHQHRKLGVR